MAKIQTYVIQCPECNKEIQNKGLDFTEENYILLEHLSGMEFYCPKCDEHTSIEISTWHPNDFKGAILND